MVGGHGRAATLVPGFKETGVRCASRADGVAGFASRFSWVMALGLHGRRFETRLTGRGSSGGSV